MPEHINLANGTNDTNQEESDMLTQIITFPKNVDEPTEAEQLAFYAIIETFGTLRLKKGKQTRSWKTVLKGATLEGSTKTADKVQLAIIQTKARLWTEAAQNRTIAEKRFEEAEKARKAEAAQVDPIDAMRKRMAKLVKTTEASK